MTATIDHRQQVTMSSAEVNFRHSSTQAATCLSDTDVVAATNIRGMIGGPSISGMIGGATRPLRPNLIEAMTRLVDLGPNWDGSHAKEPAPTVLEQVAALLSVLPEEMPDPDVFASTEGGVMLEWETNDAELLLHVTHDGLYAVVSVDGNEVEGSYGQVRDDVGDAVARLIGLP